MLIEVVVAKTRKRKRTWKLEYAFLEDDEMPLQIELEEYNE